VLLTTQYLDEADQLASQIVIIDHGRSVAAGTPAELKQRAGRNVIEVHVRNRADVARVASGLAPLGDGQPQVDEPTRRVSIGVAAGTVELKQALASLEGLGVTIDDVALRSPTLDEVFLGLTGQQLSEDDETTSAVGAA
jgi:ABC-2 type transport system ATP-binding protein